MTAPCGVHFLQNSAPDSLFLSGPSHPAFPPDAARVNVSHFRAVNHPPCKKDSHAPAVFQDGMSMAFSRYRYRAENIPNPEKNPSPGREKLLFIQKSVGFYR